MSLKSTIYINATANRRGNLSVESAKIAANIAWNQGIEHFLRKAVDVSEDDIVSIIREVGRPVPKDVKNLVMATQDNSRKIMARAKAVS